MTLVEFSILAFTITLAFLALCVPLAKWISAPLPVVLAGLGLAYGAITAGTGVELSGVALDPFDLWFLQRVAIDDDAMLYVFLPPLLFEMSIAVNVRRLLDEVSVVIIMAVLAVVVATGVIGAALWSVSALSILPALILGAAVATTDPGAVVTTFREIGAPRRLLTILEGESLLNDAAAITIFTLLLGVVGSGVAAAPLDMLLDFGRTFSLGALSGLAVAAAGALLYPLLRGSTAAEVSLTVAVAYAAFLLAETALDASGVVAVVFAGLATGSVGFLRMGPRNWNTVSAIWQQIGFWASGLILLLVASMTPGMLVALEGWQVLLLVPIYLGALLARAVILWGVLPVMDLAGVATPINQRQKVLVLWGGVRGAVTLVLALAISQLEELGDEAQLVGALAAGYTLITLTVNASTLAWLTRRLGLDQLSPADQALRERIIAGSYTRVRAAIADLASSRRLDNAALDAVETELINVQTAARVQSEAEHIPFGERLSLGLAILCGQELRLAREAFEEGAIGSRAYTRMWLHAERLSDAAKTGGREGYTRAYRQALAAPTGMRFAVAMQRWFRWDSPLRQTIELSLTEDLETDRNLGRLARFCSDHLSDMIGEDAAENLRQAIESRRDAVNAAVEALELQYPGYASALDHALLARAALRSERREVERMQRDGVISEELFEDLMRAVDRREAKLRQPPRLDLMPSPARFLRRVPMFRALTEAQRRQVVKRLRTLFTTHGELLVQRGERGDRMYFVASGALELRGSGAPVRLGSGDFFGGLALIAPDMRRDTEVVSLGHCRLLTLSRSDFRKLAEKDPTLGDTIRKATERRLKQGIGPEEA